MKSHEELKAIMQAEEAAALKELHKQCFTCAHWKVLGSFGSKNQESGRCCHCILDLGHCRKQISDRECGSWEDATKVYYEDKTQPNA